MLLLSLLALTPSSPAQATAPVPAIEDLLAGDFDPGLRDERRTLHDLAAVRRFYQQREFRPAWTGPGCQAAMTALIGVIDAVDQHGLEPDHYHLQALLGSGTLSGHA